MAFYKAAEKFGMECMQLTPAFDIDLFAEPDNLEEEDLFSWLVEGVMILVAFVVGLFGNSFSIVIF